MENFRKMRTSVIVMLVLIALLVGACGPAEPSLPPMPTNTPMPTFTPTPPITVTPVDPAAAAAALTAEAQQAAAQAQDQTDQGQQAPGGDQGQAAPPPTDTPTPEPAPASAAVSTLMNVRSGPGTNYNIIGTAEPGQRYVITGKNPQGDWWQIDYNGQSGWLFGQLVTAENTEGVQVAANIPAPPPPTATPIPQPTPTPVPAQPTPTPAPRYEFNIAVVQRCDPNGGTTYVNGTTYKGGAPVNGYQVAFSYAPDGPIVAQVPSGPHPGYPNWNPGFYSHILKSDGPREGDWYFWIVDASGNRISEIAHVHTDGVAGDGKCQQAVVDFDSR